MITRFPFDTRTGADVTAILLPNFGLLRFSGADARQFLHGQLTCDVQALPAGRSTYGGYCSPKGRLLATFLLWHDADAYFMLLPADLTEPIRKRLAMYVLRAKVTVDDMTPALACIGVTGPQAAAQIAALGGSVPAALHALTIHDDVRVIAIPVQRYLVIAPRNRTTAAADVNAWNALDIAAGVPFITPPTQEQFVAQMVNLDLIGGLSYTKGCYPGQEIVARTHYLGRLKQRMFRCRVGAPAAAGDKLYCDALGDQTSGMIVTAATDGNGNSDVLAVLQTAHAGTSPYHLGSLQGPVLEYGKLPYPID